MADPAAARMRSAACVPDAVMPSAPHIVSRERSTTVRVVRGDDPAELQEILRNTPEVNERNCGIRGREAGQYVVQSTHDGRQQITICTDRIEHIAATAEANAAQARAQGFVAARQGLVAARAAIAAQRGMRAEDRAEALRDIDEAMAEIETESRSE